jgi:Zn-dependent protease with chaperone function
MNMITTNQRLAPGGQAAIVRIGRTVALHSFLLTLLPLVAVASALVLPLQFGLVGSTAAWLVAACTLVVVGKRLMDLLVHERSMTDGEFDEVDEDRESDEPAAVKLRMLIAEVADLMQLPLPDLVYRRFSPEARLEVFAPFSAEEHSTVFVDQGFVAMGLSDSLVRTALGHEMGHLKVRSGRWFSWYLPLVKKAAITALTLCATALALSQLSWGWLWLLAVVPLAYFSTKIAMALYEAKVTRVHEHGADAIAEEVAFAYWSAGSLSDEDNSLAAVVETMIRAALGGDPDLQLERERPVDSAWYVRLLFNLRELFDTHPHPDERIALSRQRVALRRADNCVGV